MATKSLCFLTCSAADTVEITGGAWNNLQEYIKRLEDRSDELGALEAYGVKNWYWYDDAIADFFALEGDEDEGEE